MAQFVCSNAICQCSFGMAPSPFTVIDPMRPKIMGQPIANIMDYKPMVNIKPFGMCQSMANPTVASATAAAFGVLTPMPCMPVIAAPWAPGAPILKIANFPALLNNCKCMCNWGGVISVNFAGYAGVTTAK